MGENEEKAPEVKQERKDTRFKIGNKGKPKGAKNKVTRTVKEVVLETFNALQNDPKLKMYSLKAFAQKSPRDFYQIAAKLIPSEIVGANGKDLIPTQKLDLSKLTNDEVDSFLALAAKCGHTESGEVQA